VPGRDYEHVPAGPERVQQRLARERGHHRRERGVDSIAALAQHVRTDLGGQRMTGCDDAELGSGATHELTEPDLAVRARPRLCTVDEVEPLLRGSEQPRHEPQAGVL
jgi:hypothetical protein